MTGPEHYAEAERLIAGTMKRADGLIGTPHPHVIALAQVHATLAHAAAAITAFMPLTPAGVHEWRKVTGPEYAAECAREATP